MNWVATMLFSILGLIALVTLVVLLKVFVASGKAQKERKAKAEAAEKARNEAAAVRTGSGITLSSNEPPRESRPAPKPAIREPEPEPEPDINIAKKVLEEEEADPVAEAEIFITYGLNDKAVEMLEKHLANNPADEAAKEMLARAKS